MADEDRAGSIAVARGTVSSLLLRLAHAPPRDPGALTTFVRGQRVGPLEVVREIGRGGFGVVYEARDHERGESVALKALRMGGPVDPREDRLLREADAAARLTHPNIVRVLAAGQWEAGPYLVLELLRGETLGDRWARGAIPLGEALRIGVEVARGVAHAHAEGVIHRDLTPGNVFLCADGAVKVLDFGMAHAFGRRKLEGGTRAYMAPEQRRGAPEDERTDVFALGIILHRMISGELPFPADAEPIRARAPHLQVTGLPGLGALVARMLAIDPVHRPRDAERVLAALVRLQAEAERSPGVDRRVTVRRPRRGRARIVAASALGALASVVAIWILVPPPPPPVVQRDLEPPRSSPTSTPAPAPPAASTPTSSPPVTPAPSLSASPGPRIRRCNPSVGSIPTPAASSGDGVLTVLAEPVGRTWLEGRDRGETPVECRVVAGRYRVRVGNPRFGQREVLVEVRPGERKAWTADLVEEGTREVPPP